MLRSLTLPLRSDSQFTNLAATTTRLCLLNAPSNGARAESLVSRQVGLLAVTHLVLSSVLGASIPT